MFVNICIFRFFSLEGHELSSRLSKAIQRETDSTKKLLAAFNSSLVPSSLQSDDPPSLISWSDITDVTSWFWQLNSTANADPTAKRRAIALYQKIARAREEESMLKDDMVNYIKFFIEQHGLLHSAIKSATACSSYGRGVQAILHVQIKEVECRLKRAEHSFSGHAVLPPLPNAMFAEVSSSMEQNDDDDGEVDSEEEADPENDEDWEDDDGSEFCS